MQTWQKLLPWLAPALVLVAYAADRSNLTPACLQQPRGQRQVQIHRVIDGDTVVDHCQENIRLLGVDTPEIDTAAGKTAAAFTQAWLSDIGRTVNLDICDSAPRDRYGRLLARIATNTGRDLASELLKSGNAWTLPIAPCGEAHLAADKIALEQAIAERQGMWSQQVTTYVTAALATESQQSYVFVEDTVSKLAPSGEHSDLLLGEGKKSLALRVAKKRLKPFKQAGFDLENLVGKRLRVQGKLYRKAGQRPRLHLDYPLYLTIVPE